MVANDRLPWFRCFPTALLGAISGMPPEDGLAYVVILLRLYETGGPVSETARSLARRTGLSERKASASLDALIASGKVQRLSDGRIDSRTTHEEIGWQNERRAEQSNAGKISAEKRREKSKQNQRNRPTRVERGSNHLEEECISDANASVSETSSDDTETGSPKKRAKTTYPEAFQSFWTEYPTDPLMSKKAAFQAWQRLDRNAQQVAIASLPAFRAYCASHADYRPVHANRYLTQERFVGFYQDISKVSAMKNVVFVAKGSPEWDAWQRVKRTPVVNQGGVDGWWFDSEWPPTQSAA